MLQNSISFLNWSEIIEKKSPYREDSTTYSPILYNSNLDQSMLFYKKYFEDFPNFKIKSLTSKLKFLRMHYRGCDFTINEEKKLEFDGKCPTLTNFSSPFIFYFEAKNIEGVFGDALKNGFKFLPLSGIMKNFEVMIFLVLCEKK